MTLRLVRRIEELERGAGAAAPFTIILCQPRESSTEAIARWESEHGHLGGSQAIVINLVEARL